MIPGQVRQPIEAAPALVTPQFTARRSTGSGALALLLENSPRTTSAAEGGDRWLF